MYEGVNRKLPPPLVELGELALDQRFVGSQLAGRVWSQLDPDAWEDPQRFDITRDLDGLKKHYAFGKGIHYCMGAPLSRVEGAVTLELILDRLPNLRLAGEPSMITAPVLHGVETLPVAWDPPS